MKRDAVLGPLAGVVDSSTEEVGGVSFWVDAMISELQGERRR